MTAKKFISVFLTLCMLLTLGSGLSLSAFAEGETWTDVGTIDALRTAAATDGAYIRLTADITFSDGRAVDVPAETAVTLDLNGHAVSRGLTGINADSSIYGNVLTVKGKLTIEDSSGDNSGKITGGYCRANGGGISVTGGELILNGGSICDNVVSNSSGLGGGVLVNNGSFTMNGGLIYDNSAGSGDTSTGGRGGGVGLVRSTFTMNGGRIFCCGSRTGQYNVNRNSTSAFGGAVYVSIGSTFTMTGGQLGGLLNVSVNQSIDNQAFKAGAAVYVVGYSESSQGDTYPAGAFYMTGGTITGSYCTGNPGGAVYLGDKAVFEMSGSSVIKSSSGYGVNIDKGGIFKMSGGTITENGNVGGIRVNGTFNMTGGVITENKATYGGGVFVDVNGHFTMSGNSLITSNSASYAGGGVYLKKPTDSDPEYTGGTFTMNGGTISDNKLTGYNRGYPSLGNGDGGGVWVGDTCTFNMNGGTITGNRSTHLIYHDISDYDDRDWHVGLGGVFVSDKATFNLSGPSQIYGNLIGDKPESVSPRVESDVFLDGEARINVTDDLTGAYVGLMHYVQRNSYIDWYTSSDSFKNSEVMTTGYSTYNPDVHPMAYFFSDVDGFAIVKEDGQAKVLRHTHNFTYTLNAAGDTLSASCSGCNIGNVFIKISAAGGAYTGQPFPATLTVRPEFRMLTDGVLDEESIVYLKDGQFLDGVPTEIGNYTAKCTVPIGDAEYTVSVNYSITAPVHECVWDYQSITWTAAQNSATGYTAVANYKCTVNGCNETNTVNAVITPETLPAATCVAQTVTLTATVGANDSFDGAQHTDTKDVTVPANGAHSWAFVDFTWTADESSATGYTAVANYKCSVSGCNETNTVNAVITPETLPAATCVAQTVTLTATVQANDSLDGAQHTDTKDVTVSANGPHSWAFVDFTWTADESSAVGYTAAANYKCSVNGCNETNTVNAVITPETLPAATCVAQTVTLTATVGANDSLDGALHTDTKDATVPASGPHSWAFVDFTWTADESSAVGYTAAANYKCSVNGCNATDSIAVVISPETLLEKKCVEAQSMTLTANVEATVSLDGELHTDEKEISVLAYGSHDMGAWVETKAPTCTETGEERSNCSRCDYYETRTVKANGHTMGAWVESKAPTCTEEGEERSDCANCDYYETRTVKANGHAMGAWVESKAPTCTKAGEESRSCANCTVTETRPVAKLGHNWGEWIVTKEATCTEEGTETRTCRRDASHTETRTIPTVAHTDADGDNLCDNCGETVKEAFRCGFCDKYEAWKDVEYFGLIVSIVHLFVHLAQHISYIT